MQKLKVRDRLRAAWAVFTGKGLHLFSGTSGPMWGLNFGGLGWGSRYDYAAEAGDLWDNSIVMSCLRWVSTNLPSATLGVGDLTPHPNYTPDHPGAKLVNSPNGDYDGSVLWSSTVLSLFTDGNAYWRKVRSLAGQPVQLWYLPHYRVEPVWPRDGSAFISGYRYRVDGREHTFPKSDIVHLRSTTSDPLNERKGMAPLRSALREVCTDNEAATYTASLLRNSGVPGALLSPKGFDRDGRPYVFEEKQRRDLLAIWKSKFTGDSRGEPLVAPIPMEVSQFAFNPEQMLANVLRELPEERICALFGIPPVVVGMGTGLRNSTSKASYEDSRRAAYENCIVPTQDLIARQLTMQLLDDFEPAGTGSSVGIGRG